MWYFSYLDRKVAVVFDITSNLKMVKFGRKLLHFYNPLPIQFLKHLPPLPNSDDTDYNIQKRLEEDLFRDN